MKTPKANPLVANKYSVQRHPERKHDRIETTRIRRFTQKDPKGTQKDPKGTQKDNFIMFLQKIIDLLFVIMPILCIKNTK